MPRPSIKNSAQANAHWRTCRNATMVPAFNALMAYHAVQEVNRWRVPGDIVEVGVWAGGLSCFMALAQKESTVQRRSWLFDTFEGMPAPTERDGRRTNKLWALVANGSTDVPGGVRDGKWAYTPLDEVQRNMARANVTHDIRYVKGRAEDVLRSPSITLPESISVLRLDTDWYMSTKVELDVLWPRLSPGGWLYVDDYGAFRGSRRAVDEWLRQVPSMAAAARKAKAFKVAKPSPQRPLEDQLGSFAVWKGTRCGLFCSAYNESHPFDVSNETLWSLWAGEFSVSR